MAAPAPAPDPTTGVIPDAGVYGAQTAAATNAYNNAVAQATAQRNALYHSYGLTNTGTVDPLNPTGAYQQMLRGQSDQFLGDEQNSAARGLGTGGLARQAESHDRNDALAQDFQFQAQVAQAGSDYQNALQDALTGKNNAISDAYNNALNVALQRQIDAMNSGDYTAPGTGTTDTTGGAGGTPPPPNHPPHRPPHHPPHRPPHRRPPRRRRGGGGGGTFRAN